MLFAWRVNRIKKHPNGVLFSLCGIVYKGDGFHHGRLEGLGNLAARILARDGERGEIVDGIHASHNLAKGGIFAVKTSVLVVHDEELTTAGVGIVATRHRDHTALVLERVLRESVGGELTVDGRGRTRAVTVGASALDHKALVKAVEREAVIEAA